MKKLFGQLNLSWKRLIIFAVLAGLYTGAMAAMAWTRDTSFADISITFEWWVLFGILIIVNSKAPLESGLKCLVFFLISQPLVYLVQVPFNAYGWGIFRYYPGWFVWTLFTFPMGFVGWYMKKNKWYSLLILAPMLVFVGYHYFGFLREALSFFPNHLLSTIFCAACLIIYPLFIFSNKQLKTIGLILSLVILAAATVLVLTGTKSSYTTTLLLENEEREFVFDDSCEVRLEDEAFGKAYFYYEEGVECWSVRASFVKTGETKLILTDAKGAEHVYRLTVYRDSYRIEEITPESGGEDSGG